MTRSVKEKERLRKIKQHEEDGTRLHPDLLKLKFCYKTKDAHSIMESFSIYEAFNKFLRENMAHLILDIAKNIKQYDIKVKLIVSTFQNYKSPDESYFKGVRIKIILLNFKNEYLGQLISAQEDIFSWESQMKIKNKDDIRFVMLNIINKIMTSLELTLSLTSNTKCKLPLIKKAFNQYRKDLKLNDNIKKDIGLIDSCIYANTMYLVIHINNKISPFFWYTRKHNTSFSTQKIHLNKLYDYNNMTYFKNLIQTLYPDLNITDDYYIFDNIDEIKRLVRLMNY